MHDNKHILTWLDLKRIGLQLTIQQYYALLQFDKHIESQWMVNPEKCKQQWLILSKGLNFHTQKIIFIYYIMCMECRSTANTKWEPIWSLCPQEKLSL